MPVDATTRFGASFHFASTSGFAAFFLPADTAALASLVLAGVVVTFSTGYLTSLTFSTS